MDARSGSNPADPGEEESLIAAFLDDIGALGYAAFDAFCIDPATIASPFREGNWAIASYDLGIVRDYAAQGMASLCPALMEAGRSLRPYDYVALMDSQRHNPSARWQRRVLSVFGVHHAWIVPMSSLHHVKGVTVYMAGRGKAVAERFAATRDEVHLRAIHFFEALEATGPAIPEEYAAPQNRIGPLTAREAECLKWAAEGKTNGEIAIILGISENTVRYHFKNILSRLGARSRAQAVAMLKPALDGAGNGA